MKTLSKLILLAVLMAFWVPAADAQLVTPNTTLSAAQSLTATTVCLTVTTNVVNQTGVYVDNEYETVTLSNSQVVPAGPTCVPVRRGVRAGAGPVASHASGAIAWLALTPGATTVPGSNGFQFGTALGADVGACTRANLVYLPEIWPNKTVKRDCANGVWVNYNDLGDPQTGTVQALAVNGAVPVGTGNYVITKAGVLADTLAAPTAGIQDGTIIRISSTTANAHTLTATGLLQTGTASVNVATFAAQPGAGLVLMAYAGKWIVISSVGITFS